MTLTKQQMDAAMERHFGFERADDVEGVLATLAPDAEHDIVGWPPGPTHGRENARPFYVQMYKDLSGSGVKTTKRLYGENFLVDESVWTGIAHGKPFGFDGRGRPLTFRILHVIEFAPSGEIQRENCWLDMAAIARQLTRD